MLPIEFMERMEKMLGHEYRAFLASYDREKYSSLRYNALKGNKEEFLQKNYDIKELLAHCVNSIYLLSAYIVSVVSSIASDIFLTSISLQNGGSSLQFCATIIKEASSQSISKEVMIFVPSVISKKVSWLSINDS